MEESEFTLNADRVAIAGVDESVRPEQLSGLSRKYPFVEWSVLYSGKTKPLAGFPSIEWIRDLVEESKRFQTETGSPMKLSVHLCELSVKGLIREEEFYPYFEPILEFLPHFQRMQLNAIFEHLTAYWNSLPEKLRKLPCSPQIIIQYNGKDENKAIYKMLCKEGFDTVFLHDRSNGQGVEREWLPPEGTYCGYAGGLKPETLEESLSAIARVTNGHPIYLDLQSGVRENGLFSLARAEQVLKIAQRWIKQ